MGTRAQAQAVCVSEGVRPEASLTSDNCARCLFPGGVGVPGCSDIDKKRETRVRDRRSYGT